ncbi:phosphotransferase [Marinomonas colpomeniae]|uniref:Phosphotransferase n=1 Tax=Marinomonas colpomeniae TaxID=2774408 RepID=A0ABR8NYJ0_9GAMM|nr:phosphotransferase [Marinomonas colpomeniae]MBD5771113.1 phosphotransferase [Marinomonas colpomeniae]
MKYRVVIPTAGLGSRLKGLSKNINKALISIAHKPAISYLIEKFPENVEFVIPLGYKADTVRSYLTLAYPNRKFIFVDVDIYEGDGSGLGYTLLKCEAYLQLPFIFISNDTLVLEDIKPPEHNWMGYAHTDDNAQYRSIRIDKRNVVEICPKGAEGDVKAYIGLAGIHDYEFFWQAMRAGVNQGSIEIGESFGLRTLINEGIEPIKFTWFDTGNISALNKTRDYFSSDLDVNILEKEDEAIWFLNDRVIKFSIDESFIKNRVLRAASIKNYIPELYDSTKNMYMYKKVEGETFSKKPSVATFKYFLDWMESFWEPAKLDEIEEVNFESVCHDFYKEKTYKRVKQYFINFEQIDSEEIINGKKIPRISYLLDKVDWSYVEKSVPVRFHGDLHFENILINDDGKTPFTLLDWRQDFGGNMDYGDIYYDFGKLNHGMLISHELINKNFFEVDHKLNTIHFDFLRKQSLVDCEVYFKMWIEEKGYDYKKVRLMTALIYLNIASLHHYPYSMLLFYLGKSMLFDLVDDD